MGLCRLLPIPAGRWPFPTLSLNSLCRCLDPYPAMSSWCTRPFLPRRLRLHIWWNAFRTSHDPGNAASAGSRFRGCSHSLMFRPLHSLSLPAAPTARSNFDLGRPGLIHHAELGWLPAPSSGIATHPFSGNWYGWTFTSWNPALSAAPPPYGSSVNESRGYVPQSETMIRGFGSGKSRSKSANRSHVRRLRWLRRHSHLYQARFTCSMTNSRLTKSPLTPK